MNTPDLSALTAVSQRSTTYYRDMAQACRRSAAIERAQVARGPEDERHEHGAKADRLDGYATQWEALATELETFAAERTTDHPDQGALL